MRRQEVALRAVLQEHLDWPRWTALLQERGYRIDRARGSHHPTYPDIVYPIDYGYIPDTLGTEGDELDVFVGSASTGLVGAIFTTDYRRGDRECKLLYNTTPEEVYLVNGFINFDRALMEGTLVLRVSMSELRRK